MTQTLAAALVPKAELHVHIEGVASPDLVRELADQHGVDVSGLFAEHGSYAWTDFARHQW